MPSGFTATSRNEFANDVGVLSHIVGGQRVSLGATRGGIEFNPNREVRSPEFDGKRHRPAGSTRVINWDSEFTGTLIQIGDTTLPYLEPGAVVAGAVTTPASAAAAIEAGDEIEAPWLTFTRNDGTFFSICFYYGFVDEWSLSGEDQNEAEIEITIKAEVDPEMTDYSTDMAPYYFREDATNPVTTP